MTGGQSDNATLVAVYPILMSLCEIATRPSSGWSYHRYNNGQPWEKDSAQELCHDVLRFRLLDPAHPRLNAIRAVAADEEELKRLLRREIRYTLQRRERIEPFTLLLKRVRQLADSEGSKFVRHVQPRQPERFAARNTLVSARGLSPAEIRRCARACKDLPIVFARRLYSTAAFDEHGNERRQQGSKILSTPDLQVAMELIVGTVESVTTSELREIFSQLLTPWDVKPAGEYEESATGGSPDPETTHHAMTNNTLVSADINFPQVRAFVSGLSYEDAYLLVANGSGHTAVAMSKKLGPVRQVIARRKDAVIERAGEAIRATGDSEAAAFELRTLAIKHLSGLFIEDLSPDERHLWVCLAQQANDAAARYAAEREIDLEELSERLFTRFKDDVLTALVTDNAERDELDYQYAIAESVDLAMEGPTT